MRAVLKATSLALFLSMAPALSQAACVAPPQLTDETKKVDTEGAIGQFMKLVGLDVKVSVATEKKTVFEKFQNASQMVVQLTIIYMVCTDLEADKTKTAVEKAQILGKLYRDFEPAAGPQPIASTAPPRPPVPSPQDQLGGQKGGWLIEAAPIWLAAMDTPAVVVAPNPSWADIYLNPNPIVITDKNKYFVIVASASSEGEGVRRMKALKSKYPNYDFELYGPYGSNPKFGIMIAAWVSRERADEALRVAKTIDKTSFLWQCRSTGDAC